LNDNPLPCTSPLRVHCDGSFFEGPQEAAYGVVVTNSTGQICDGRAGNFVCSSPIVSEAKALLEAVSYAARSPQPCMVFSDYLILVAGLNSHHDRWPWDCYGIIARIRKALETSPSTTVQFTPRCLNGTTYWVARSSRDLSLPPDWLCNLSAFPTNPG
ncbi:hypothetical protein LINPERHAP1_LOCUS11748, partial [Linum perenne]